MTTVCEMFVHVRSRSCIRARSRFFYSFISQTKQWRVNEIHTEIARSRAIRSKVLWSTCNSAIAIILSYQVRKSFHKNRNTLIHPPFVCMCHFSHSLTLSLLFDIFAVFFVHCFFSLRHTFDFFCSSLAPSLRSPVHEFI